MNLGALSQNLSMIKYLPLQIKIKNKNEDALASVHAGGADLVTNLPLQRYDLGSLPSTDRVCQ